MHLASQAPITALDLAGNHLYAGVGAFLHTYDTKSAELLDTRRAFAYERIHGLAISRGDLIVWGGRSIAFGSLDVTKKHLVELAVHDWVIAASFGPTAGTALILTAHNEIVMVDIPSTRVLKVFKCEERSILYSGALHVISDPDLGPGLVAAGTVMGGVLIWDLRTSQVIHRLSEHEGSIFGVSFNEDGSILASCSDDWSIRMWDVSEGRAIAKGWGHTARIWGLRFLGTDLVSCSEDCTVRLWSRNTANHDTLECTRVLVGHQGRNVWAIAAAREEPFIATGGGDGKILLWNQGEQGQRWELPLESLVPSPARKLRLKNALSNGNWAVVLLTNGELWHGPFGTTQGWCKWGILDPFALLRAAKTHGIFAVGRDGRAVILSSSLPREFNLHSGLREALIVAPNSSSGMVLVQGHSWVSIEAYSLQNGVFMFTMDLEEFFLSSALLHNNQLWLGSRHGSLALYILNQENGQKRPRFMWKRPKVLGHRDCITAMQAMASGILVADREGAYVTVDASSQGLETPKHHTRSWIEGVTLCSTGWAAFGFRNSRFVMWNMTLDCETMHEECGGRRRAWHLDIDSEKGDATLAYLSSPTVATFRRSNSCLRSPRLLRQGTHGREIRAIAVNPSSIVATAGEDTRINVGKLEGTAISAGIVLRGHSSSIQCLQFHPDDESLLFSAGAKCELIAWRISIVGGIITDATELSRLPQRGELRITGMDILGDLVATVYSDSTFRVWRWMSPGFSLIGEGRYRECCLLNVHLIQAPRNKHWLVMSATDGHIAIYVSGDLFQTYNLALRSQIHQSGVRCSAVVTGPEGGIVHYSGGDDNSLHAVLLDANLKVSTLFHVKDAHSSTVTSLAIIGDNGSLWTTGADQKVRKWSLDGKCEATTIIDTADPGTLVVSPDGSTVMVAGCGVSFLAA